MSLKWADSPAMKSPVMFPSSYPGESARYAILPDSLIDGVPDHSKLGSFVVPGKDLDDSVRTIRMLTEKNRVTSDGWAARWVLDCLDDLVRGRDEYRASLKSLQQRWEEGGKKVSRELAVDFSFQRTQFRHNVRKNFKRIPEFTWTLIDAVREDKSIVQPEARLSQGAPMRDMRGQLVVNERFRLKSHEADILQGEFASAIRRATKSNPKFDSAAEAARKMIKNAGGKPHTWRKIGLKGFAAVEFGADIWAIYLADGHQAKLQKGLELLASQATGAVVTQAVFLAAIIVPMSPVMIGFVIVGAGLGVNYLIGDAVEKYTGELSRNLITDDQPRLTMP